MKNKRGQFYLMAAIVIIAVLIGFFALSNKAEREEHERIYNLKEELGIESARVLDYGVYSSLNETQMENLLMGFTKSYANYAGLERIYFIFGSATKITVAAYHELYKGEILVNVGSGNVPLSVEEKTYKTESYTPTSEDVIIIVEGHEYKFTLKEGENFYFVIFQTIDGERYVVTSEETKRIID